MRAAGTSRRAGIAGAGPGRLATSLRDTYQDDRRPGRVAGTRASDGTARLVTDPEGVISIDHGALRIAPLARQGWGRASVAYGPLQAGPGLVLAGLVLNGHQNAQSYQLRSVARQVARWIAGGRADSVLSRTWGLVAARKRETLSRRLEGWLASRRRRGVIAESFVFGFSPAERLDPEGAGPAFCVRAAGPQNGHLMARVAGRWAPVIRGLADLPLYLLIALREGGAAYYAGSLEGARGCVGLPEMRPLAIDPGECGAGVFAGFAQSVMAEIGFSIDSRVSAVAAGEQPEHSGWSGAALLADWLRGNGPLHESDAQRGGMWRCIQGSFSREAEGTLIGAGESLALLDGPEPSGLAHAMVRASDGEAGLVFRAHDAANFWRVVAGRDRSAVILRERGRDEMVAQAPGVGQHAAEPVSVQVCDDGRSLEASVNGASLTVDGIIDARLGGARGVGLWGAGSARGGMMVSRFEVHPRRLLIPAALDLGRPWSAEGTRVLVHDDFDGPPGDLAARLTPLGRRRWSREIGRGRIVATGDGAARVEASVGVPAPGRIVYAVPWDEPALADVEVQITPPGSGPGQAERCRSGLCFWQDRRNYVMMNLWLDEAYGSASISCFWRLAGYEDIYDAVWTNLGSRVRWGRAAHLRIVFDGNRFLARVDGEPVLYRALTDVFRWTGGVQIRKVGLLANWEWGTDTGTVFRNFTARGK
jgi:hypothetical protein